MTGDRTLFSYMALPQRCAPPPESLNTTVNRSLCSSNIYALRIGPRGRAWSELGPRVVVLRLNRAVC